MSSTARRRYSLSEYLEQERVSDVKHEFYDGEIFAMAGASREHNFIYANLMRRIGNALEGGPCVNFGSDMRVKLSSGLYTYPDVTIVCGKREYAPEDRDALVNPSVVLEVLSPSTTRYDTGRKFRWYQETPSIQEICFVDQDEPRIRVYRRSQAGWLYDEAPGLDQSIRLQTGGVTLPLVEVYRNVEFPDAGGAK
jgi:Uma2 family endonuclease